MSRADLHTHSRVSDGTDTPEELIVAALSEGLDTIALTDHDTTEGLSRAANVARSRGVRLLPGVELSARDEWVSVHILGYLFDPQDQELSDKMREIRESRRTRAESIVERINVDYELLWDEVVAQSAEGATIGRPHIADALIARGYARDRGDAFEGILHWRSGYVRPHYAPSPVEAVRLIRAAGGVPVLAHPGTRDAERVIPPEKLEQLVEAGLFGLEIDHPENNPDAQARLRVLAQEFSLATTGSSDYHGTGKSNRLGECTTSDDVVDEIIRQASGAEPVE